LENANSRDVIDVATPNLQSKTPCLLLRHADIVGRDSVMAGTDCGTSVRVWASAP
jgi:hypothetical protein